MRKLMGLSILAVVLAVMCLASCAYSQETMIWNGTDLAPAGITLGTWGSGTATIENKDKKRLLEGNQSIKITSDGQYMGARLDFAQPISLAETAIDPAKYLVLTIFFPESDFVGPSNATYNPYDIVPYRIPKVEKLRVMLISDTGVKVPIMCPTNPLDLEDNWVRVAIPMAKLVIPKEQTSFKLARLVVASSTKATFWLSQIKLVTDNNPIKVDGLSSQVVAVGDYLYFQANVRAGVSPVLCSWNFSDGTVVAAGPKTRIVSHPFNKGGDFTISLTVTDALGVKTPVTVSNTISVSD